MLIDEGSDRILGFTIFGAEASELMATVQTAMLGNMPFTSLRDALFAHPTAAKGLALLLANVGRIVKAPVPGEVWEVLQANRVRLQAYTAHTGVQALEALVDCAFNKRRCLRALDMSRRRCHRL